MRLTIPERSLGLRTLHHELIAPAIRHHQGRLVQTGGDSMLIIFETVAQAVKCAVTIQSDTAINADYWPSDQRMRFRIGVDLGDIIMDGMNFHGDGVIVASRLQAVCPPAVFAYRARCMSVGARGLAWRRRRSGRWRSKTSGVRWRHS